MILFLILFILFPFTVFADDITNLSNINVDGLNTGFLTDDNEGSFIIINKDKIINITSDYDIYGIYIRYELESQTGIIEGNNNEVFIGFNGFLHEYIDINGSIGSCNSLNIKYDDDVKISEINVIGSGEIPNFVEVWHQPLEKADLMLCTTHSDDEQLFFLGLLPTYVAKGADVQVVYLTNHNDNPKRLHEQLHGLYTVGIRNYPIIGFLPDAFSNSLNGAITNANNSGYSLDDIINFQINMIRRFKPLVVVGHDEKGEYSHGQHILNTYTLKIALDRSNDSSYHKISYKAYGGWDVPKTYLHLYDQNPIIMDYDTELEYFDGLTAY